jgi:hypothetical protein
VGYSLLTQPTIVVVSAKVDGQIVEDNEFLDEPDLEKRGKLPATQIK